MLQQFYTFHEKNITEEKKYLVINQPLEESSFGGKRTRL